MKPEASPLPRTANILEPAKKDAGVKGQRGYEAGGAQLKQLRQKKETVSFGNPDRTDAPIASFKKTVEAVIKANKLAQACKDDPSNASQDALAASLAPVAAKEMGDIAEYLATLGSSIPSSQLTISADGSVQSVSQDASQIIQAAIAAISRVLKLSSAPGLSQMRLNDPSDGVKEQLAEILFALKGIDGLLNEAIQKQQSIDVNGLPLDPGQALAVEQVLRVETFRIEMALSMAGLSADIAEQLTQKNNQPVATNIIAAMDPSLVSTSPAQVSRALSSGIAANEQTVETLFKKLAASMQGSASAPEKSALLSKIAAFAAEVAANQQPVQEGTSVLSDGNKKGAEPGPFDAKVMRTLLKIDATEGENKDAAQGAGKINISDSLKTLFAKDLNAAPTSDNKAAAAPADASVIKNADNAALLHDVRVLTTSKTMEESVVSQLSDKLQAAVKTWATEIRLLLRPESLGEIRMKLTLDGDVVMGKIYVENQQVKHIIENNMQSLKDSLAQHNLQTGTFDVNVGGDAREQMQEMAQTAMEALQGEPRGEGPQQNEKPATDVAMGRETGRRYGSNTIEFFA